MRRSEWGDGAPRSEAPTGGQGPRINYGFTKVEDSQCSRFSEGRHSFLRHHDASARSARDFKPRSRRLRRRSADKRSTSSWASKAAGSSWAAPSPIGLAPGFAPVRKKGKLPSTTVQETYDLEYGTDCLEIHSDAVEPGQRVLIIDDVLATGGTAAATTALVRRLGGQTRIARVSCRAGVPEWPDRSSARESVHSVLKYSS